MKRTAASKTMNLRPWLLALLAGAGTFVAYILTLSPTVGLIDSGELAAGCRLLNILHPTGYPLYTMLGRLASLVPIGAVVNRVAVLSALLAATGIGLLMLLLLRLGVSRTVAAVSALVVGFSYPVWSVAVDVEVYSLTLVLLVLLWSAAERAETGRQLLIFAYLCGLVLTNHMSAASAVLGAGVAVLVANRRNIGPALPAMAALAALSVSLYLFLVLRSRAEPLLAWGNPHNLERLWWHVTGKQYQVWMFSTPMPQVMANAGRGALLLARSLLFVLVPVACYGAVRLSRERRSLALGLVVSAVVAFGYAVNYSIPDIEAYYIPCLPALCVFAALGLEGIARRVGRWRYAFWILALAALVFNFKAAGKQGDYVAFDQAMNTLQSARLNATVLTDWWDLQAPVFYLQHVETVRPDVCMIDKELLRRSWYFKYLAKQYPWLVDRSRTEIDAYLAYLDDFEHDRLRDPGGIQRAYVAMMASFVTRSPDRPAYMTFDRDADADARELLPGVARVPVGLLFELRSDTVLPSCDYSQWRIRLPAHTLDQRTRVCLERYRFFVMKRAAMLAGRGRATEANELVDWYQKQPVSRLAPLPMR